MSVQPSLLLTWECLELSHLTQSSTNQTQLSLVFQQRFKLQLLLMGKLSYVQSWVYTTIDHRIVDGMNGAKFMVDLKHLIENPMELLI